MVFSLVLDGIHQSCETPPATKETFMAFVSLHCHYRKFNGDLYWQPIFYVILK